MDATHNYAVASMKMWRFHGCNDGLGTRRADEGRAQALEGQVVGGFGGGEGALVGRVDGLRRGRRAG